MATRDIDKVAAGDASLVEALARVMPHDPRAFLEGIGEAPRQGEPHEFGGEIASVRETLDRSLGLLHLVSTSSTDRFDTRLGWLLRALRALQNDRTFDVDVETLPEYLDAAKELVKGGFRFVVFGHTHLPRRIRIGPDAEYLNSGTWANVIRFPKDIIVGPEAVALEGLRAFVSDMAAGRLTGWVSCSPSFVRLDVDETNRVSNASLTCYSHGMVV